jgi:hypothetical protein
MGKLSTYTANKILDHILKTASFTQPTNLYVALYNGDPSGTGTECPGTEYARQAVNDWDTAANRATANTSQINFPEIETNDWGTVDYIAIFDALTGGNLIAYDAIDSYVTQLGDNLYIGAGDLDVSIASGGVTTAWANKILDHIFKNDAITVPTNLYVGASTANPTDNASGISEPSGGAYARKIHNAWDAASLKATENTEAATFTQATASWGEITHAFISDSVDAVLEANIIFYSALGSSILMGNQDTLNFADGAIDIAVDAA